MESWDDEDFVPTAAPGVPPVVLNKWEGEDEDEEVKESWEDEDEEKEENAQPASDVKKPKKKSLQERVAEKERLKREEMERRLREEDEDVSPEEKLRRQQESDLKMALETTFGGSKETLGALDDLSIPDTKEEFDSFTEALSKKLTPLSKNVEYPTFVENLTRNLCATMTSFDIKKIKNSLDNLYLEKQKFEKGDKNKKSKGGKGKARLRMEGDNQLSQLSAYTNDYDEFDDFM